MGTQRPDPLTAGTGAQSPRAVGNPATPADGGAGLLYECQACGMHVTAREYHPYLACLAFRSCHSGATVRANLEAVIEHGRAMERTTKP